MPDTTHVARSTKASELGAPKFRLHALACVRPHRPPCRRQGQKQGFCYCYRCWVILPSQLLKKMVSAVQNPGCNALNHVDLTTTNTPTSMQCPTHSMRRAGKRAKERAAPSLQTCCPRCQITVRVAPMVPKRTTPVQKPGQNCRC